MGLTMIAIKDLKKTYVMGKVHVHALRGISLKVDKGEFLAVMGASGSGKSTLARVITGLLPPVMGSVSYDGVFTDYNNPTNLNFTV